MVLGLSIGTSDAVSSAVKDSYSALKALVAKRLSASGAAPKVLHDFEESPTDAQHALITELEATGADKDPEIIRLAQEISDLGSASGLTAKYQVVVSAGGKVGIIGDGGHIDSMS